MEATRFTGRKRIKRLLVLPVMAFCWAHRTGEWRHETVKPIKVKNISAWRAVFLTMAWIGQGQLIANYSKTSFGLSVIYSTY